MGWKTGLIGLWGMEELSGTRVDASSAGNDLAEDNGAIPRTATRKRGAFAAGEFSTSFLIRSDANLSTTFPGKNAGTGTVFTLGFWFYIPSTPAGALMQIFTKGSGKIEVWWETAGSKLTCYLGGKQQVLTPIALDTWHHVIMTYDGVTLYAYLDNTKSAGIGAVGAYTSASQLVIGCFDPAFDSFPWEGYIDELFVYDRVLTESEIALVYSFGLTNLIQETFVPYTVGYLWKRTA